MVRPDHCHNKLVLLCWLMLLIVLFLVVLFPAVSLSQGCHGDPKFGNPNTLPINELSTSSKLINTVHNGKLYLVTVPQSGPDTADSFYVMHLWGTPYEMGFAAASLRPKETVVDYLNRTWAYFEEMVEKEIEIPGWLPKWLEDMIVEYGLDAALDITYEITKGWTNPGYFEELRGYADASGAEFMKAVRIHMFPGLTQGKCSMLGAWGDAVDQAKNGLLQMRALDWETGGPILEYPQLTVYHPNEGNGHAFASVGFMGFIGGLTGMSEKRLGISEIGVYWPDDTFGKESRIGVPFVWLLRDILQFDLDLQNATDRMINTRRTCDLILGVGDGNELAFNAYQYSYEVLNVFGWQDMRPEADWHPRIKDVIYYGMDWLCPTFNEIMAEQTKKYYGKLDAEIGLRYMTSVEQSGDNHIAYYGAYFVFLLTDVWQL